MRIEVELYGHLRAHARVSELVLEVPQAATVQDVLQVFAARCRLAPEALHSVAVAVDAELVPRERALRGGERLVLLPPVSGG